jgi:hypothetical protein
MGSTSDGQDLEAGRTNIAQSATELRVDVARLEDGNDSILRVRQGAAFEAFGAIRATAARFGVIGEAGQGAGGGTGLQGIGKTGVEGNGGDVGVEGRGGTGIRGTGVAVGVVGIGINGVIAQGSTVGLSAHGIPPPEGTGLAGTGVHASGTVGVEASSPSFIAVRGTSLGGSAVGFLGGPDPQFGEGAGAYGQSAAQGVMGLTTVPAGTGVYGGGTTTAGGRQIGVRGETATGTGVQGTSFATGTGVSGKSATGRGGVFESTTLAQVRLTPLLSGGPPRDGLAGDLVAVEPAVLNSHASLWFCIQSSSQERAALWGKVQFSEQFRP